MLDALTATCGAADCDRELRDDRLGFVYRDAGGERRVYECACGRVTVTLTRSGD